MFKEVIDSCLEPFPEKRPSIESLLSFPMFSLAPKSSTILQKKRISSSQPPKPKKIDSSPLNLKKNNVLKYLDDKNNKTFAQPKKLKSSINFLY